jgi:hypothetical protein
MRLQKECLVGMNVIAAQLASPSLAISLNGPVADSTGNTAASRAAKLLLPDA